ncbi:hypothetical protein M3231_02760 [Neobacillus mesonae]|nr:hypothetical protein [Neobacillus mesonae]
MGYKLHFNKTIAAIASAITSTLYSSWMIYTPVTERLPHIGYSSFSGIFAFNFVPLIFFFIVIGLMLSPLVDSVIYRRFDLKGIKGILTIALAYLILGALGGTILSIFFLGTDLILNHIITSILCVMLFLSFQTVIPFFFHKLIK